MSGFDFFLKLAELTEPILSATLTRFSSTTKNQPDHYPCETYTPFTEHAGVVLARNPSAMTLAGTNTWILRSTSTSNGSSNGPAIVVDPGPNDQDHLHTVAQAAGPVGLILITHEHPDHTKGLAAFHKLTGAPSRSFDARFTINAAPLTPGEIIDFSGGSIEVLHTPGHTADSLSFLLHADEPVLFSGDTILGYGPSIVGSYHGALADYLSSLQRLSHLAASIKLAPGHGPAQQSARDYAAGYLAHRRQRLQQVRHKLTEQGVTAQSAKIGPLVRSIYADQPKTLWPAAAISVKAQLEYLQSELLS